jgi:hypothetical protein
MKLTIGVDPGITGAIAFIDEFDIVETFDLPTIALSGGGMITRRIEGSALHAMVKRRAADASQVRVFCEEVNTMGGRNNAVQTQGALVGSLRAVQAVFDVLGYPCVQVLPQAWQAFYGLQGKNVEERQRGELPAAIRMAVRLFPDCGFVKVKDHNKAESLLIAHWGRRHFP